MLKLLKCSLLLIFLFSGFYISAQPNISEDTVAVLVRHYKNQADTSGYMVLTKGQQVLIMLKDTTKVEGTINKFTADSLMLDSVNYAMQNIIYISTFTRTKKILLGAGVSIIIISCSVMMPMQIIGYATAGLLIGNLCALSGIGKKSFDIKSFHIYSRQEYFEIIYHRNKFHKVKSDFLQKNFVKPSEKFDSVYTRMKTVNYSDLPLWLSDSTILIKRHREFDHKHSISVGIFDPLANEINLTYGFRINKFYGIELTPGILFQTDRPSPVIPFISYESKVPGFSYSPNDYKGYQAKFALKCYFPKRPNRYIGFNAFFKDISYSHRIVRIDSYREQYLPDVVREQSEHSQVLGCATILGWQTTLKNNLCMDFFLGIGTYFRWGDLTTFSYDGTIIQSWHYINYNSQYNQPFVVLPSLQAGMKIGFRFGKSKI